MYGLPDSRRPGVRYVVYVLLVIITLVAVLAWAVVAYHWSFENSYTLPANAPNGLTTERKGPVYWVLLPLTVMRILLLTACVARSANSRNRWFRHILSLTAFALILVEIAALVIFIIERNACNNPPSGNPSGDFNMCNDYQWCCVYALINTSCFTGNTTCFGPNATFAKSCPILLQPCLPTVLPEDLGDNWVFDATFASTVIFMALGILHIVIGSWMKDGSELTDYSDLDGNGGYMDGGGEDYDMEGNIDSSTIDTKYTNDSRNSKKVVKTK